jgi:hypothetical protein
MVVASAIGVCVAYVGLRIYPEPGGVLGFMAGAGLTVIAYLFGHGDGSSKQREFDERISSVSRTGDPSLCGKTWGPSARHGAMLEDHSCTLDVVHKGPHICRIACNTTLERTD